MADAISAYFSPAHSDNPGAWQPVFANLSQSNIPKRDPTRMKFWRKCILLLFALPIAANAQDPSPNSMVRTWTDGAVSPKATINDVHWLVGDWEGKLEGGMQQHTAFPPTKGHMPGFARGWGQDGSIWFYEIR
jgi:hypothetical protein